MKYLITLTLLFFTIFGGNTALAQNMKDGHEYVDLGLPSGILWATCNIGAEGCHEAGSYFAWGEIEQSDWFSWENYKWGDYDYLTKYNGNSNCGIVDNRSKLQPRDDAAHMIWGGDWRMPTMIEVCELAENCKFWYDGQSMMIVQGPNGNILKLFLGGDMIENRLEGLGVYGYFWTSELYDVDSYPQMARLLFICEDGRLSETMGIRSPGYNIRPVCPPDPSGIDHIMENQNTVSAIYSVNGVKENGMDKGLHIIMSPNGKARKIIVN